MKLFCPSQHDLCMTPMERLLYSFYRTFNIHFERSVTTSSHVAIWRRAVMYFFLMFMEALLLDVNHLTCCLNKNYCAPSIWTLMKAVVWKQYELSCELNTILSTVFQLRYKFEAVLQFILHSWDSWFYFLISFTQKVLVLLVSYLFGVWK